MIYLGQNAIGLNHMITSIGSAARVESGIYTPTNDTLSTEVILEHSLGTIPDFILVLADPFELSENTSYFLNGCFINYHTSKSANTTYWVYILRNSGTNTGFTRGTVNKNNYITNNTFTFPATVNSIAKLKGGITYHYILGKFNEQEVTSNA